MVEKVSTFSVLWRKVTVLALGMALVAALLHALLPSSVWLDILFWTLLHGLVGYAALLCGQFSSMIVAVPSLLLALVLGGLSAQETPYHLLGMLFFALSIALTGGRIPWVWTILVAALLRYALLVLGVSMNRARWDALPWTAVALPLAKAYLPVFFCAIAGAVVALWAFKRRGKPA